MSSAVCRVTARHSPLAKTVSMRKELGVLVLLLAAETVCAAEAGCCGARRRYVVQHGEGNTIGSIAPAATLVVKDATPFASSETSSTGGETESTGGCGTPLPFGEDFAIGALVVDAAIVSVVLSYLPWRKVVDVRRVSRTWFTASASVATLCRLPTSGVQAVFVPCLADLDAAEQRDEQLMACDHGSPWKCGYCGFWNAQTRIMCGDRNCQQPAPSHRHNVRLFLGQLRRSGTVSFIKWLVRNLSDHCDAIVNVENHRHKVTGRGKGCAWAYVATETAAATLLSHHRRVYHDIVGGVEGVWIVHERDIAALDDLVEKHGTSSTRPRHMPRTALVVERPSAMCADVSPASFGAACPTPPAEMHTPPMGGLSPYLQYGSPALLPQYHHHHHHQPLFMPPSMVLPQVTVGHHSHHNHHPYAYPEPMVLPAAAAASAAVPAQLRGAVKAAPVQLRQHQPYSTQAWY